MRGRFRRRVRCSSHTISTSAGRDLVEAVLILAPVLAGPPRTVERSRRPRQPQSDGGDPVTAFFFVMIKRPIRGADEAFGEFLGFARHTRDARHPETCRDRHSGTAAAKRPHGRRFAQLAADRYSLVNARVWQYHREFFAAEPTERGKYERLCRYISLPAVATAPVAAPALRDEDRGAPIFVPRRFALYSMVYIDTEA